MLKIIRKYLIEIGFLVLLFCMLINQTVFAEIQINEIMYNPSDCSDSECEWIELYNPDSENYSLEDCNISNKEIGNWTIAANEFVVLARDSSAFNSYFEKLESTSTPIEVSMSLSNSGETIELSGTEWCSDNVDYTDYINFADGNNYTIEKSSNGEWYKSLISGGSPFSENSVHLLSSDYSFLQISELLPNPMGDDDAEKPFGEWIEIYNSGAYPINLDSLYFKDSSDGKLYISETTAFESNPVIEPDEHKIIFRNGDSDFSLNNNVYESITLYVKGNDDSENRIDSMSYSSSTELMSWSLVDEEWQETLPTPNEENEFLPYCNWDISIEIEESIMQEDDLDFTVTIQREYGNSAEVTVKGKIIEYNGNIIEEYFPWTNASITTTNSKDYSPNLNEGIYELFFWIEDIDCNDYEEENNYISKLIAINPEYKKEESILTIDEVYLGSDESAEWGDQIRTKVSIYKGDETKYTVELYATINGEQISKRTKLNIYEEYQYYTLTLPIQLDANCNAGTSSSSAKIVLEGLNIETEAEFEIEGIDEEICTDYFDYIEENNIETGENSIDDNSYSEEYQFIDLFENATAGELIQVTTVILADDAPHNYTAYAYAYKGSWCYSCEDNSKERNETIVSFSLAENELHQETFLIKLDEEMDEKEYNIKVKFRKDDRKTDDELTASFTIISEEILTSETEILNTATFTEESNFSLEAWTTVTNKGILIYQSTGKRARNLVPALLFVACTFLIFLLWQKN